MRNRRLVTSMALLPRAVKGIRCNHSNVASVKAIPVLTTLAVTSLVTVLGDVGEAAADVAMGAGPTN